MDVFKVRRIRETGSASIGTLDSVHQEIVQGLMEVTSKADTDAELAALHEHIKAAQGSNEIGTVIQCSQWEARIKELTQEATQADPVQDYYLKNMDILMGYYNRESGGTSATTVAPKDANTFLKYFATAASTDTGSTRKQMFDEYVARMKLSNVPEMTQLQTEHCTQCNVAREEISSEGILVCPKCGSSMTSTPTPNVTWPATASS